MRASPFIKPLEGRAIAWEALLVNLQDILDNWLQCQVGVAACKLTDVHPCIQR
jgi:hypothetical protein